jgi:hypothetical protein
VSSAVHNDNQRRKVLRFSNQEVVIALTLAVLVSTRRFPPVNLDAAGNISRQPRNRGSRVAMNWDVPRCPPAL